MQRLQLDRIETRPRSGTGAGRVRKRRPALCANQPAANRSAGEKLTFFMARRLRRGWLLIGLHANLYDCEGQLADSLCAFTVTDYLHYSASPTQRITNLSSSGCAEAGTASLPFPLQAQPTAVMKLVDTLGWRKPNSEVILSQ